MQASLAKARADQSHSRTKLSLKQFLATKAKTYEAFLSQLWVTNKAGKRIPFKANRCQRRYIAARTRRDLVLKARQQGFTTEALARDIWFWLTHPGANVLIVCQSINHSAALKDVTDKLRSLLASIRNEAGVDLRFSTETNTDWKIEGREGSLRVIEAGASKAAAQKKGRAGTIGRLHLTELAFWEFAGETLNAMLECVAEGGDTEIEIESTANGSAPAVAEKDRDVKGANGAATFHWRYGDARAGKGGYAAHFFEWWLTEEYVAELDPGETIDVDPNDPVETRLASLGVTPEQFKWRRKKIASKGLDTFDQEYPSDDETCFLLSGRQFFDKDVTKRRLAEASEPAKSLPVRFDGAHGTLRIWHEGVPGHSYVVSVDTSEGSGGDAGVCQVYERTTGRHMASLDGQFKPWELARAAAGLGQRYGWAIIAVERNNHGHAVLRALHAEQKYPNIFFDRDEKPGWLNHEVTRAPALDTLEQAYRAGHYVTRDRAILSEFRTFVVTDSGKAEAARGAHDDHVIAAAIGWDVLCRPIGVKRDLRNLPPA